MKITKPNEPLNTGALITMIIGDTGIGKTTLAMSAKNCVLFDFDEGAYRGIRTATVVEYKDEKGIAITYTDVIGLIRNPDFRSFSTVVFDTIGTFINKVLFAHIRDKFPKYYDYNAGMPDMKGWGIVGACFLEIFNATKLAGVDIVFLAHEKKENPKKGEIQKSTPAIQGGALQVILAACDQIGYMFYENEKTFLDFRKNQHFTSKDTAGVGLVEIKRMSDAPRQFQDLIQTCKSRIAEKTNYLTDAAKEAQNEVIEIRQLIKVITDPEGATMVGDRIKALKNGMVAVLAAELVEAAKLNGMVSVEKIKEDGTKYKEWEYATVTN